jgi:hypothetical protein
MTATTITRPATTVRPRRRRARLAGIATAATSTLYLAASAAGVDFLLTDSQSPEGHHLIVAEIAVFTLFFALLGWGSLAVLEKVTRHAKAVWLALATAVLLLSFVPISLETSTAGTKAMLTLIHGTVYAIVILMARPTRR